MLACLIVSLDSGPYHLYFKSSYSFFVPTIMRNIIAYSTQSLVTHLILIISLSGNAPFVDGLSMMDSSGINASFMDRAAGAEEPPKKRSKLYVLLFSFY